MKKLIIIILLTLILTLTACKSKNETAIYVDKCKEEFTFDYEEEIIYIGVATNENYLTGQKPNIYIIDIYGEKTHATYICNNGEVWNYENQSN